MNLPSGIGMHQRLARIAAEIHSDRVVDAGKAASAMDCHVSASSCRKWRKTVKSPDAERQPETAGPRARRLSAPARRVPAPGMARRPAVREGALPVPGSAAVAPSASTVPERRPATADRHCRAGSRGSPHGRRRHPWTTTSAGTPVQSTMRPFLPQPGSIRSARNSSLHGGGPSCRRRDRHSGSGIRSDPCRFHARPRSMWFSIAKSTPVIPKPRMAVAGVRLVKTQKISDCTLGMV